MADFNLSDAFGSFLNQFPGVGNGNLGVASVIPSLASAWNQYKDADRYEDLGREAGAISNPFTNEMRQGYAGNLGNYYKDPSTYLKQNPEFMASMSLGLDQINAQNSMRGKFNGEETPDQLRFLSKLSSQYVNQDLQRLMQLSGANFNNSPQQGNLMMRGGEAAINSRNNALDALMAPLGLQTAGNRANGGNPTTQPGGYQPRGLPNGGGGFNLPPGLDRMLQNISPTDAASLFQYFGRIPGGLQGLFGPDMETTWNLWNSGIDPNQLTNGGGGFTEDFGGGLGDTPWNLGGGTSGLMDNSWDPDPLSWAYGDADIPYWDDGFDGGGDWSFDWGSP